MQKGRIIHISSRIPSKLSSEPSISISDSISSSVSSSSMSMELSIISSINDSMSTRNHFSKNLPRRNGDRHQYTGSKESHDRIIIRYTQSLSLSIPSFSDSDLGARRRKPSRKPQRMLSERSRHGKMRSHSSEKKMDHKNFF